MNEKGFAHLLILGAVLLIILAAIGGLIFAGVIHLPTKTLPSSTPTPSNYEAGSLDPSSKTEYSNPFEEEKTVNPFDTYQNPFDTL